MTSKVVLFFALLAAFSACDGPQVVYGEAQPAGAPDLEHFGADIVGRYASLGEPGRLDVTPFQMIASSEWDVRIPRAELDTSSECLREGGQVVCADGLVYQIISEDADSLTLSTTIVDTLFQLGQGGDYVLRKEGDAYFLNVREGEAEWHTQVVKLGPGGALWYGELGQSQAALDGIASITALDTLARAEGDTLYRISPSSDQMRRLINEQYQQMGLFKRMD